MSIGFSKVVRKFVDRYAVVMAKEAPAGTRADTVYARLRADICNAQHQPGQRLKFPDLCARYDTSVGVAREALTRLTAERLVTLQAHQGYAVASLSEGELIDLTRARVELEALTFRLSILNGDERWESDVVAAHHLLGLREREVRDGGVRGDEWYRAHEAFHAVLTAGCGNQRLTEITRNLRTETELYRRWAASFLREDGRDPAAEHQALARAATDRDSELGPSLLSEHISSTTRMLLDRLGSTDAQKREASSSVGVGAIPGDGGSASVGGPN
jgi:DNA-binding GntR family transcriptional regulator